MTDLNALESLYFAALEKSPAERPAFLDAACGPDADLRARVERLLAAQPKVGGFLDAPAATADIPANPRTATFGDSSGTADLPGRDEHVGAVLGGKYKLVEEIGEGGMGSVFMAQQTEPVKRAVAVKVIKAGMDSKAVLARFEAERQALAMMDHPNIARVLDAGTTESGRPYFVMELVKGTPITQFCDDRKLTPRQRLELFVPVCQAIQHAHQKGVIHRDIKPSNVLVALYDDKPVPKVIDFGVAKAAGSTLTDKTLMTGFGAVVGTPEYMSPEQASLNNLDIDTRSDVYSLGVLLYELLTGSTPVDRKSLGKAALLEVLRIVREVEAPKPSAKLSTIDTLPSVAANRGTEPAKLSKLMKGELDWVLLKALEKDRTRRYDTANALARDIQRYLSDEVVEARPPSTGYRLKKFVKRHKGQVLAASLVLFALVAGVVGTTLGLIEARRQAEIALAQEAEAKKQEAEAKKQQGLAREEAAEKERQRAKASKARDRTRDVLDAMVSGVTGNSLTTQTEISAEQKKFLESVLGYYREFAGENPDDERSRWRQAKAAWQLGVIEWRLGRKEESAAAFRLARDGYASLTADFPLVPDYRAGLSGSHGNLGRSLWSLGEYVPAEEQIRKALAIIQKLAADSPDVPDYRKDLAMNHTNLGMLLADIGQRPAAEEQLRKALAIEEKLVADFPAVPDYRQDLAASHNNLGILLKALGQSAAAEEQLRLGLAIVEKLVADYPAVPVYRKILAGSHGNLGNLLKALGQRAAAEEQNRKALAIHEKLAADFPTVPDYRQDLAMNHNSLGNLLVSLRKSAAAEEQFRKALAILEKLTADFPTVPAYRTHLATSHNNLATLFQGLGQAAAAAKHFRKGLTIREKLADDFPTVFEHKVLLGGSYCNFGYVLRTSGEPAESLKWFGLAIERLQPVHEKEPHNVLAKQFLRNSHSNRAESLDELQKFAEAVTDWDRAIALSPPAEQRQFRAGRALSWLQVGKVTEAVSEVADLTKVSGWPANYWYDFACVYAVASGKIADKKAEYAERAMELLLKAAKAGYKDAAHMKTDTDLDPLRDREDFKTLVADLEKKFPPPPPVAPPPRAKK